MTQKNMSARWRYSPVRTDKGEHVGFAVFSGDDAPVVENVMEVLPSEARAAHMAHTLDQVDAGALHKLYPARLIRRMARTGRVQ